MRRSRAGLALCAVYTLMSVAIWVSAGFLTEDPKGKFVLMQLPVVFAAAAAGEIGVLPLIALLPNIVAWTLLFLPTLACIYCIGWAAALVLNAPITHSKRFSSLQTSAQGRKWEDR